MTIVASSSNACSSPAILVTGATGAVGRQVVQQLAQRGANVRALVRDVAKAADLPAGVTAVQGDLRHFMPGWMAYDMRLMAERFLTDGMVPEAGDVERLTTLLGRPLRSYRDFAKGVAAAAGQA